MLRVPQDLEGWFADRSVIVPEASVIRYVAGEPVLSVPALVARPTFVWVRAGVKQLQPQGGQHLLTVPSGQVLVMRSGTHVMSEFRGQDAGYQSLVVSIDRTFLRQAVGVPGEEPPKGPRVVVSQPAPHAVALLEALPQALLEPMPDVERQFKLREVLVALMGDKAVRQLVFEEVADWGQSLQDRIVSVSTDHCLSPLQVPDLAQLCAMSLSSFKRHFQGVYGVPPGKWLIKVRMEHARSRLLNSDNAVSQVCLESGYQDVSSFIRAFRRHYGMTPTQVRRER